VIKSFKNIQDMKEVKCHGKKQVGGEGGRLAESRAWSRADAV
jgi:hypothetical protein